MPPGRLEQGEQMGTGVDLSGPAHVVPAHPLPVLTTEGAEPELGGVEAGTEQKQRHGTDADGVVTALYRLGEGPVKVGERLVGAGTGVPGEVPQRDGEGGGKIAGQRGGHVWSAPSMVGLRVSGGGEQ